MFVIGLKNSGEELKTFLWVEMTSFLGGPQMWTPARKKHLFPNSITSPREGSHWVSLGHMPSQNQSLWPRRMEWTWVMRLPLDHTPNPQVRGGQPYLTMQSEIWKEIVLEKQKEMKKEHWAGPNTFQSDLWYCSFHMSQERGKMNWFGGKSLTVSQALSFPKTLFYQALTTDGWS